MSEPTHTPGPWKVVFAETSARWPVIVIDHDEAEDVEVAEISGIVARHVNGRWRRDVAGNPALVMGNAHLIAAAPDLLAALKAVVTPDAGGAFHHLTGENAKAALAAIAKAEGR